MNKCLSSGAHNEGVPLNICSALEVQLAGKIFIFIDFGWTCFIDISSSAGSRWLEQKEIQGDWTTNWYITMYNIWTPAFTRRSPLPSTNRSCRKSWFELV